MKNKLKIFNIHVHLRTVCMLIIARPNEYSTWYKKEHELFTKWEERVFINLFHSSLIHLGTDRMIPYKG